MSNKIDFTPDVIDAFDLNSICEEGEIDISIARELLRECASFSRRPFRASTPGFRDFDTDELGACRKSATFPAFSITGGACALDCAHCHASILKPLIPAGEPLAFERLATSMIEQRGMRGFLLSGGSNRRNEVPFDRYLPAIERIKAVHPDVEILVHTGLVSRERARRLASSGVDVAMLDIIGARETIQEVYNLDRPVGDFEESLAALVDTGMKVVPHIVAGLHFGRLLGETNALGIIARHRTESVIIVVLMHAFADAGRFGPVNVREIAGFFSLARGTLNDRLLMLGCARPHGKARRQLDLYAMFAGFDGIAYPADGVLRLARLLGRPADHSFSCCGGRSCPGVP